MKTLRIKKCEVCIHPFCAILAIIVIYCGIRTMKTISGDYLFSYEHVIISFLIFVGAISCLLSHEYAHVLAARRIGLPVRGITVSLFGAHTSLENEPRRAKDALVLSVVGPAANLFIGISFYAGYIAFLQSDSVSTVFLFLSVFNMILGAYNLLPVMPLDGGLIVRSTLWLVSENWVWSTQRALHLGNGFAALCILAGILFFLMRHSIMSGVLCVLGLSLWQNERLAYQKIVGAKIVTTMTPNGF